MDITYHPAKRDWTLQARQLDFEDARVVFSGKTADAIDGRFDYGETRVVSAGYLNGRMVIIVWTPRGQARHVLSMRKANEREQKKYAPKLIP